jgi:hypothetical protein
MVGSGPSLTRLETGEGDSNLPAFDDDVAALLRARSCPECSAALHLSLRQQGISTSTVYDGCPVVYWRQCRLHHSPARPP